MAERIRDRLDELIDEITVDCYGEDEQLWGFLTAIEDALAAPAAAEVVGAPVELIAIDYDGDPRRGLVASCRRGGHTYVVSALDVLVDETSPLHRMLATYRRWSSSSRGGDGR